MIRDLVSVNFTAIKWKYIIVLPDNRYAEGVGPPTRLGVHAIDTISMTI